ncbi:hypothetical protein LCGC14_2157570, partial [marine sediment metagenome]
TTVTPVRGLYVCGYSTGSFNNAYHRNIHATSPTTWEVAGTDFAMGVGDVIYLSDMIQWTDKIIAQTKGNVITSSNDGENWVIDQATDNDPIYRARNFVNFIGVAIPPWGEGTAVYFLDSGKFYVLDFGGKTAYEIKDVGEQNFLLNGTSWNGNIFLTDGVNVWEYAPGLRETIRHLGPFGKDGAPKTWLDGAYVITQFLPGTSHLFALARSLSGNECRLLVYQGTGWSWFGEVIPQMPYCATVERLPMNISLNKATRYIDIFAFDAQNSGVGAAVHSLKLPGEGDIPFVRAEGDTALAAVDIAARTFFENGPLAFETGWYDGGFSDIEGVLHKLKFDGFHMSQDNTVKVEYRLDNNENAEYTLLGTFVQNQAQLWFDDSDHLGRPFTTVQFRFTLNRKTVPNGDLDSTTINEAGGAPFSAGDTTLTVASTSGMAVGEIIIIESEQLLITAIGGADLTVVRGYNGSTDVDHAHATAVENYGENPTAAQVQSDTSIADLMSRSPEIKTMVLVFEKIPQLRTAWSARIDFSRMKEEKMMVDDRDLTVYGYWQFLKKLRNKKPLIRCSSPPSRRKSTCVSPTCPAPSMIFVSLSRVKASSTCNCLSRFRKTSHASCPRTSTTTTGTGCTPPFPGLRGRRPKAHTLC